MAKKLHHINQAFDWTYYITIDALDKTIFLRRLDSLFVDFKYKKWVKDSHIAVIDSTIIIVFSGRTISDGVPTVYPNMIWDKIVALLEVSIDQQHISNYTYKSKINNIEAAHETLERAEEKHG